MSQQNSARPLRPLAPRIPSIPEIQAPESPTEESRAKRASSACKECKRRRTKCSTGNPCTECAARQCECVYDELADKRRKVAAKRTQERLIYYRGVLERLLDSIRLCEPEHVTEIVNLIRGGGSLKDIATEVDKHLGKSRVMEAMQRALSEHDVDESDQISNEAMEDGI